MTYVPIQLDVHIRLQRVAIQRHIGPLILSPLLSSPLCALIGHDVPFDLHNGQATLMNVEPFLVCTNARVRRGGANGGRMTTNAELVPHLSQRGRSDLALS